MILREDSQQAILYDFKVKTCIPRVRWHIKLLTIVTHDNGRTDGISMVERHARE